MPPGFGTPWYGVLPGKVAARRGKLQGAWLPAGAAGVC